MAEVKTSPTKPLSRRDKAAATRKKILDAAQKLFAEHGYAGTTMQAIADEADVAVQTVYFVFHTKGELLRQMLKAAGGRPDEPIETMERDWVEEALAATDGRRSIALLVEHGTDIFARVVPVWAAIGQGATTEPDVAELWNSIVDQRRLGMRRIVESIDTHDGLRDGLTIDRAADIVFAIHRPETLAVLTDERGWSLVDYKDWCYQTLCQQLLALEGTKRDADSPTRGLRFDPSEPG